MQQVHLAPLRQSFRQGAVQGVHGGGVAVEAGLRRGGVPQQGEGVRFQVEGLWQLLVEIGDEQAGKVIASRRGVQQVGSQGGVEDEALRPQAVFQQRPRQVLDIVGDLADVRREQGVQKGVPVPLILVEEQLRRDAGSVTCSTVMVKSALSAAGCSAGDRPNFSISLVNSSFKNSG